MRIRLVVALSWLGLLSACAEERSDGLERGAAASTAQPLASLAALKEISSVALEGVVRGAEAEPASSATLVDLELRQVVWTRDGDAPEGHVLFQHLGGDAPSVGDEVIVFMARDGAGRWLASGDAAGRFEVVGERVVPATADGVSLPPDTDRAGFVSLLETPPETSSDLPTEYGGGYGGSY